MCPKLISWTEEFASKRKSIENWYRKLCSFAASCQYWQRGDMWGDKFISLNKFEMDESFSVNVLPYIFALLWVSINPYIRIENCHQSKWRIFPRQLVTCSVCDWFASNRISSNEIKIVIDMRFFIFILKRRL